MYRTTRGAEQRRLQCLQDIQNLQEEIKLLQISNEKLNGVGLDDMSFTELASLGSIPVNTRTGSDEGFRIVDEQLDNAHEEITTKQIFEYDLMGGPDWTQRIEKEDLAYQSLLAGRRVALRNKAREFRLSPPETQPWRSDDPERLKMDIDSLEMEKERLRLFNQRMLGKELDGMSYSELFVFSFEISGAIMKVVSMKKIKRDEEMGKTKRPRPSVNKQEELKLLQIPNEKLNGEGLNGLSYSELSSIENMLNQGLVVVEEQTDKVVFVIIIFSQSYRFDF
ncbi:BnaA04g20660D [Brassica napus]|uniref:BnaA04g20660D protein n=1 Tax=Brassica napus TaxID=3708 RepID=A0A078HRW1_BRANA|nr:BnaA04g20660D [Brassica napus]